MTCHDIPTDCERRSRPRKGILTQWNNLKKLTRNAARRYLIIRTTDGSSVASEGARRDGSSRPIWEEEQAQEGLPASTKQLLITGCIYNFVVMQIGESQSFFYNMLIIIKFLFY
ncbi:hypothetical protein PUN28_011703 [Cardiocondyla obscurior]|uniref:Uncharacterized protein n=1 Tax=Cardiocondyla obscurior TaxID=286306 RepID=A0AAW2FF41_9HYME